MTVHNHEPWRPVCNERLVDGVLLGACMTTSPHEQGADDMSESKRRILKWSVPVDDQWHPVGCGPVVHVACQNGIDVVSVWTDERDDRAPVVGARAFATGQPLPERGEHIGSAVVAGGRLVWHVLRTTPTPAAHTGESDLLGALAKAVDRTRESRRVCEHPHYNSAGVYGSCGHLLGSTGGMG